MTDPASDPATGTATGTATEAAPDPGPDDSMLDEAWLSAPKKRSRLRLVLCLVLAASLCFLGGAVTQKYLGASASPAAGGLPMGGAGGGLPEGFPGGSGGAPEGFPGSMGGAPSGSGGSGGSGATDAAESADAVIGTVVKVRKNGWVVEDLGGTRHEVAFEDGTTVVREQQLATGDVKAGDLVHVTGTDGADGLQAGEVVLRNQQRKED